MGTIDGAFARAIEGIEGSVTRMAAAVPAPRRRRSARGDTVYRYAEEQSQQALVLKVIRTFSALLSAKLLVDRGLVLDAGASFRILDELGSDIMFLSGPLIFGTDPEPRHLRYLSEFFQEEFDHADPLESSQRRDRVSRRDIRAYVARTFHSGQPVSRIVDVTETIDNAFSGYIHGAAVHTMDVFDGTSFCIPLVPGDRPLEAIRDQLSQYVHRALMAVATAAKALGEEKLFRELYELQGELFTDSGDLI